jgi:hypothetical protein
MVVNKTDLMILIGFHIFSNPESSKVDFGIYICVWRSPMLGGSLVTTAWRILRLQMEETPSSFGGKLQIY